MASRRTLAVLGGVVVLAVGGAIGAREALETGGEEAPATLEVSLPEVFPGEMLTARWDQPAANWCEFDSDLDDAGPVTLAASVDHHRFGPVTKAAPSSAFAQVVCATPGDAPGILDDFNRADVNPAGPPWIRFQGVRDVQIVGNQLTGTTSHGLNYYDPDADGQDYAPDQEAFVTVATPPANGNSLRLILRGKEPGPAADGYVLRVTSQTGTDKWTIRRMTDGVETSIGTDRLDELDAGAVVKFKAEGSTLRAYENGDELFSEADATYPDGGLIGLGPQSTAPRLDDFGGGNSGGGLDETTTIVPVSVLPQPYIPPNKTGTFDTSCVFREGASLHDDPIVFPGMPGASHLHDFFGTRGTNANSNGEELLLEGREDLAEDGEAGCRDVGDHAAYWAPALWRNGVKMDPENAAPPGKLDTALHVYYRGNSTTVSFPVGFGMVSSSAGWACGDRAAQSTTPINCAGTGRPVTMIVKFPHCWDGVNLTSTDKSHVSNATNCADTDGPDPGTEPDFPVDLPRLTFSGLSYGNINHDVPDAGYTWTLGPNPDGSFLPADMAHADFFNAWEPFRLDQSVHLCHRQPETPELQDLCHDDTRP